MFGILLDFASVSEPPHVTMSHDVSIEAPALFECMTAQRFDLNASAASTFRELSQ